MGNQFVRWLTSWMRLNNVQSGRELGRRLGISPITPNHWLAGRRQPDSFNVEKLASLTGTPKDEIYRLLGRLDTPPPEDPEADRLLHIYRRLPSAFRAALVGSAEAMLKESGVEGGK